MINKIIEKQKRFDESKKVFDGLFSLLLNKCKKAESKSDAVNLLAICDGVMKMIKKIDIIDTMIKEDRDTLPYIELDFLYTRRQIIIEDLINELQRL